MENKQSVLVIDDSPTVRRLAESVLTEAGYDVFMAEDGDVGLEIASREIPSIILVDFIMPKMNGFQLCKSIRSDPVLNEVPIVLITSKGRDVGQGFEDKFGIARFLQKPFEADILIQTVKEVLAGKEESGADYEETVAEVVPLYAADTESDQPESLQTDSLSFDMAFVDIADTNISISADASRENTFTDTSLNDIPDNALSLRKQSVLVVDDSPTVRKLAELVLSEAGYDVFMAEDGDVGLDVARSEEPSVILVDFIMPKMNGFQFCKNIKSDPALNEIPIVLITSKGKDVGQGFDDKFGIARFLQKPFEADVLIQTVKEVLAGSEAESRASSQDAAYEEIPVHAAADTESGQQESMQTDNMSLDIAFEDMTTPPLSISADASRENTFTDTSLNDIPDNALSLRKQSVLVVDDSPTVRKLAELVLSEAGYDVFMAEDGDVGLDVARSEEPSVILVDFIMPKMNGFQFCKNIKSDPALNEIPIVLITSKGKDVGQGFDDKFGIARFLQKPFEADVLIQTVKEVLAGREEASIADSEVTVSEVVSEYAVTDMEIDAHEPHQTDTCLPNTPDVEIPSTENKHVEPVYAELIEKVNKDIRYYLDQELPVLIKNTMIQTLKETDLVQSSSRILSGDIKYVSFGKILEFINMSGLSGKLSVLSNNFSSEIYLESGHIVFASISRQGHRTCLEELMVNDGKFQQSEMHEIFSAAGGSNLTAGSMLLDKGLISEDELTDYYRRVSEDAVHDTLSAEAGHFHIEDVPLPREIQGINLRISANGVRV